MSTATINGFQHYFEDRGSGEPLVMVHGAAGSGSSFADHIPDLAGDFRVIVPDLRGMGGSAHVEDLPPSAWVDDIVGLLDHLGIPEAHLFGTSLGSRVVLRVAIDHPARVKSVFMDAGIIANDSAGNAALNRSFDPSSLSPQRQEASRRQHGDDWQAVMSTYFRIRNKADLQEHYNLRDLCAQVQTPVLIMRGDVEDPVHPLPHSVELHTRIPHSQLAIVPNCGSGVGRGAPEMMRQLIRRFVADLASVPPS